MAPAPLSTRFCTPSATHNQIGPLWCWLLSGWACALSRPLWVSPKTSPVRLGVSPAATQPPWALSIRGLRLYFPELEPWVTRSASLPDVPLVICGRMWCRRVLPATLPAPLSTTLSPALWVYLCKCWAAGSASARTACAICPTLRQSRSRHSHSSPLRPSYRSGCMFLFYLLGVRLPCRWIFCQFWLCEEVQCVHLRRHLGSFPHNVLNTVKLIRW